MEFGDVVGLLIAMGGFVGLVGLLTEAYKSKLRLRERELELKILEAGKNIDKSPPSDARIEQRLRVLERIATDKGPDLATQIEQLRDDRARQAEVL